MTTREKIEEFNKWFIENKVDADQYQFGVWMFCNGYPLKVNRYEGRVILSSDARDLRFVNDRASHL